MWQKKKNVSVNFLFLASFESHEYLSKGNVCCIKTLSLTAY